MSPLAAITLQYDQAQIDCEKAWVIHKQDRQSDRTRMRYIRALRRCLRLRETINAATVINPPILEASTHTE